MKQSITTDYAIRIVLYLAMTKQIATSKELSDTLKIPQSYVFKVIEKLKKSQIIDSQSGVQGGFTLKKSPSDITLYELINTIENTTKVNRCLEQDNFCSRFAIEFCSVRKFYSELQSMADSFLQEKTIQDLL